MKYLQVVLTSFASVVVLFFLTKLMGKRQMSQLSMFDYINGITIGSIAAEMATALEDDFWLPLIAMVVYTIIAIAISYFACKSIKVRKFFCGKSVVLVKDGKIFPENLKRSKLDINEFITECRNSGYFDINNIDTAILETNGKISFLPVSGQRPLTPDDIKINVPEDKLVVNIIVDGQIIPDSLKFTGNDETWLKKELHKQGIKKVEDVFLATCDNKNTLNVFKKNKKKFDKELFE